MPKKNIFQKKTNREALYISTTIALFVLGLEITLFGIEQILTSLGITLEYAKTIGYVLAAAILWFWWRKQAQFFIL